MGNLSLPRKLLTIFLIIVIVFTYCDMTGFADTEDTYADEPVDFAVKVIITPVNSEVESGGTGTFNIYAQVASATTGDKPEITIELPDNLPPEYLTQFSQENKTPIIGGVPVTLDYEQKTLRFTLKEGDAIDAPIHFILPNGITENGTTIEIPDDYIKVETRLEGNIITKGASIKVTSGFSWEKIKKSLTTTGIITGDKNKNLTKDLEYVITAASNNGSGKGAIFTKKLTLTDTVTLPDGLNFIDNDSSLTVKDNSDGTCWQIIAGTKVIAEIVKPEAATKRTEFTYRITDAAISGSAEGKRDKLQFKYICEYPDESRLEDYNSEMPNVDLSMTIKKDAVHIEDLMAVDDTKKIKNKVEMEALPVVTADKQTSDAEVILPLSYPGQFFTIDKRSAVSQDDNGMIITYTIAVKNTSQVPLYNLTVEDRLPSNVELMEGEDLGGGVYDSASHRITWTNQSVAYNGTWQKVFQVRVKSEASPGAEIKNIARATVDKKTWQQDTVTDTVFSSGVDMSIIKKNNKGVNGKVIPGETVKYTIDVKNSGMGNADVTITDTRSDWLINPRNFEYSTDGTTWKTLDSDKYMIDGNKITFCENYSIDNNPATLDVGSEIHFRYDATVSSSAPTSVFINNTAQVGWEDETAESTTGVTVRSRMPKVSFKKSAEAPVAQAGTNWYKVDYSLIVTNEGDEVKESDNVHIIDTMSGGLMPLTNPENFGTITGTYVDSSENSSSITGEYTREGIDTYRIIWNIKSMPAGTSAKPTKVQIKYPGYIRVPDYGSYEEGTEPVEILCAENRAEIAGRGSKGGIQSVPTYMVPKPVPDKIISKINGKAPEDPRTCEIYPGDMVEYTLTVANQGTSSMTVDAYDILPRPFSGSESVFQWDDSNVKVTNGFGVSYTLDSTEGSLRWGSFVVPAGVTKTVKVTLTFPGPEIFNQAFAPSSGQRIVENTLQVTGPNPDKPWQKKVWTKRVSHTIKAIVLDVDKTVNGELFYGGKDVTFNISGFDTEHPVAEMKLADDLTKIADYMDLETIYTGAYDTDIKSYKIILSYESWIPDKVININNPSVAQEIKSSTDHPFEGVTTVTWDFGTVKYLKVKENGDGKEDIPTITMKVKENVNGSASNGVTLFYNSKSAEDKVPVSVMPENPIKKNATVNGKEVDNVNNPLREGDRVTFNIVFCNPLGTPITIDNSNPLIDYLTTKSLEAEEDIRVSFEVRNSKNELKSGYTLFPASFDITDTDIKSSYAKKLKFTLDGELESGDKLYISYTVTIGSGILNSQGEWNKYFYNNWGYNKDGSINTNPPNLHLVHNRVTNKIGEKTHVGETGFYYAEGQNRLYFSKAVRGFSTYKKPYRAVMGDFLTNYTALESGKDLTNFGEARTIKYPENQTNAQCKTPDVFDVIFYVVTVANDLSSNDDLTVKTIKDVLPDNVVPIGTKIAAWSPSVGYIEATTQFGAFYNYDQARNTILKGLAFKPSGIPSNQYDPTPDYNIFHKWHNDQYNSVPPLYVTIAAEDTELVTTIPAGYTAVDVKMDIKEYVVSKSYGTTKPTFRVFSKTDDKDAGVTLEPGEMFAFTYAVIIDRDKDKQDPRQWINTATLNVKGNNFDIRGNLPAQEDQFITKTNNATNLNISEGVRKSETAYEAAPVVYGPEYKAGITKTAIGHASYSEGDNLDKVKDTQNYIYSANMNTVKFGDVVKWEIVAKNSGKTDISGATLKDIIPYPYEVIKGSGGQVATNKSGNMLAGDVTGISSGTYGAAGQTVTINNVNISKGSSNTYYIYTIYKGDDYRSFNYTNRAELRVNGNFTQGEGQAIYNEDRTAVIGVAAEASIYPTVDGSSGAYKEIWEVNSGGGTIYGNYGIGNNPSQNKIAVSDTSSKVKYRLTINNTGDTEYKDVVIIDKLPHVNDAGVVNPVIKRGSQFDISLEPESIVVKKGETILAKGSDYTVSYSDDAYDEGLTSDQWSGLSGFNDTASANTKTFRLALTGSLSAGEKLIVEFVGTLPSDSIGKTAWNNFGYSYKINKDGGYKTIYAEPAKVGVTVAATELIVKKVWNDGRGQDTRPANIKLTLYKQVDNGEKKVVNTYNNLTWTKEGNVWTYTFKGLPVTENGEKITYSVEEEPVNGYNSKIEDDGNITLINTLTTEISGTKTWIDGLDNHDEKRPNIILYKLVNGNKVIVPYIPDQQLTWTQGDVPADNANDLIKDVDKFTISGLPAYDENNELIKYVVEEDTYDGYKLISNKDFNLVNVRTATTELKVNKVWNDNDNANNTRPTRIFLQLYADLKAYGEKVEVTPAEDGQWTYTFKNLPKYSEKDGHEISYTIAEIMDADSQYKSEIEYSEDGKTATITNTPTFDEKMSLKVKKVWDDNDNRAGDRPGSLEVTILQKKTGESDEEADVYDTLYLNEDNNWEETIYYVPVFDDNGNPYVYTVSEKQVPSYVLVQDGNNLVEIGQDESGNKLITYTLTNKRNDPTPVEFGIGAIKKLRTEEGDELNLGDFTFKFSLTPMKLVIDQWVIDEDAEPLIAYAQSDGKVSFKVDYDLPGTYKYIMKEEKFGVDDDEFDPSIEYDNSEVYVTVEVTQVGSDLIADVSYDETDEEWTAVNLPQFINIYRDPDDVPVAFNVRKDFLNFVDNEHISFGGYNFKAKLTALTDGAPMPEGSVDGVKTIDLTQGEETGICITDFGDIIFKVDDIDKTYEYEIREVIPPDGSRDYSIGYDETVYKVSVEISKKLNANELAVAIAWSSVPEREEACMNEIAAFTNTYEAPDPTEAELKVYKKFIGGSALKAGDYTFVLRDKDGNAIDTAVNDENGDVQFNKLIYSEDKGISATYEYTISELDGKKTGVIYDKKEITVRVTLTKNADNQLVATPEYFVNGVKVTAPEKPTFENRYAPPVVGTFVNIKADKIYKNGTLNGNDFKFMLKSAEGNPYKLTKYAFNDRLGNIDFGYLEFYAEGEYKYTITEVTGDNNNIRYDQGTVNVTIKVTKTEYGTLTSSVEYEKDGSTGSTFVNEYLNPNNVTVNIFARKILQGRKLEANEFNFMLSPVEETLGGAYSVRNAADGIISFREIIYDKEGVYKYRITELLASKLPDITYDKETVDVTVTVVRNEDGRLEAKVDYRKAGKNDNTFVNTYKEKKKTEEYDGKSVEKQYPKTGDAADLSGHIMLLAGSSIGLLVLLLTGKRKEKKHKKNTAVR